MLKETSTVRTLLLAFAMLLLIANVPVAVAQEIKIGFVSTERVFREAAPAVRALKKLEKEFAPREDEIRKLGEEARAIQAQLEKEGMTMSASQRRDRETELGRVSRERQRLEREFREELNLRKNEELAAVLQSANQVIKDIAEKEKFDLILQEAVYRSPRLDITEKVIKALADK